LFARDESNSSEIHENGKSRQLRHFKLRRESFNSILLFIALDKLMEKDLKFGLSRIAEAMPIPVKFLQSNITSSSKKLTIFAKMKKE
jgi:hypothetical protein